MTNQTGEGKAMEGIWEDAISLNNSAAPVADMLGPPSQYLHLGAGDIFPSQFDLSGMAARDTYPLPTTENRESYYGDRHFEYWASGLRDMFNLCDCMDKHGAELDSYLDFGCASGRVLRHFACQRKKVETHGSDINRQHVDWILRFLDPRIRVFQNTSIPGLPLPDNSVSLVSAFSVFTHIETFETAWIAELTRVLKPGGLAWLTFHSERTWAEMDENYPVMKFLAKHPEFAATRDTGFKERIIFRFANARSYSSHVFYDTEHLRSAWGRWLDVLEVRRRFPKWQDVIILQKRKAVRRRTRS